MANPKMTQRGNRTNAEIIEDITQGGAPVPSGYVFNPRLDPPLFKKGNDPKRSEVATNDAPVVVNDPANQPLERSGDATGEVEDGSK